MANTGLAGALPTAAPHYVVAKVGAANLDRGALVVEDSSGLMVAASDGGDVFGITACQGSVGENIVVQVGGIARVATAAVPGFTRKFEGVCCAGSSTVDIGTSGDPQFAMLLNYDSELLVADVLLSGTALRVPARAIFDPINMASYPVGSLSTGRYLSVSGGQLQSLARQGSTASRPSATFTGQKYFDTDIGEEMVYDGTRWRSSIVHYIRFTAKVTNTIAYHAWTQNLSSHNAIMPWPAPKACRIIQCNWALYGTTGGITWTARLRLDGSGSDTWTATDDSVTTTWQYTTPSIDLALSANNNVTLLIQSSTSEQIGSILQFGFVYT